MGKQKTDGSRQRNEIRDLHEWISGVGGSIDLGTASVAAIEASKSGKKLTIVLKKPKPQKTAAELNG